jgi:TPR repeat protein
MAVACICNGTNEACAWCGGSGIADDGIINRRDLPMGGQIDYALLAQLKKEEEWRVEQQKKLLDLQTARESWLQSQVSLLRAAQSGDERAQFKLGYTFSHRPYRNRDDDKEAFYWYRRAAYQGHIDAQTNLGVFFVKGRGTDQSTDNAFFWWLVSSGRGHQAALRYLKSLEPRISLDRREVIRADAHRWRPRKEEPITGGRLNRRRG